MSARSNSWRSITAGTFVFMVLANHSTLTTLKAQDGDGRFLRQIELDKSVHQQKIEAEVNAHLRAARDQMAKDSKGALRNLTTLHQIIRQAPNLSNEVRTQLLRRIESAGREAKRLSVDETYRQTEAEQNRAAANDRLRQVNQKERDEILLSQLMQRFNALKAEGSFQEAEKVAAQIRQLAPNNPVAQQATLTSQFANNIARNQALRELKEKRFLETMRQVDLSSMPFPDNRPIVYPPAEKWQELTRKRAMGDQVSANEEKIRNALRQTTRLEFIETPLQDAVEYLSDFHDIPIVIDTKALEVVGLGSDTQVTKELKGISLRSGLNLLLRDLELTYMIQDEVLQITTPEVAEANTKTKIYPIRDLLTPIRSTTVNPFGLGGG